MTHLLRFDLKSLFPLIFPGIIQCLMLCKKSVQITVQVLLNHTCFSYANFGSHALFVGRNLHTSIIDIIIIHKKTLFDLHTKNHINHIDLIVSYDF